MKNPSGAFKLFALAALLIFVSLGLMALRDRVLPGPTDWFTGDQTDQQEPSASSPEKHSEDQSKAPQENANGGTPERPNIVFILTDDQAARSISEMPNVQSLLVDQGTQFENFFTTTPRCCPSRATFLRGQYAHNSGIRGNALPLGGFQKFRRSGKDRSTVATWLDDVGYDTIYLGKYLNNYDDTTYVPSGWDRWFGWLGNYYSPEEYRLNENGRIAAYQRDRIHDTDLLRNRSVRFVEDHANDTDPFFMYLAPNAPHKPAYVAKRYEDSFSDEPLPQPLSFNEKNLSDKPELVRSIPPLSRGKKKYFETLYRKQLASLQSVDEMVGALVDTLQTTGQLENTYIIFSSDNGFFYGEHRLENKSLAYEEAAKIPLVVRGPGVPVQKLDHLVINTDFSPTVAELAGTQPPGYVDGESFVPLLSETSPDVRDWRRRFLLELWDTDYKALRTTKYKYVEHSTGERELYDLRKDPYERRSLHETADPTLLKKLARDLNRLRNCAAAECRRAERR